MDFLNNKLLKRINETRNVKLSNKIGEEHLISDRQQVKSTELHTLRKIYQQKDPYSVNLHNFWLKKKLVLINNK